LEDGQEILKMYQKQHSSLKYKKTKYRVIISGGGTGGHIYPAIAIANKLKERMPNIEILFVGAKGKMEMQKVPEAGFPIKGIWISGIRRKRSITNLLFPLKLLISLVQSYVIIAKFRPDVAVGVGGFASGPLLWTTSFLRIPTLIQEQNSYAGITNKLLARKVDKICVAYDHMDRYFPKEKIIKTGNPVREDIMDIDNRKAAAIKFFNFNRDRKTIFVMGGSLGARTVNISVFNKIQKIIDEDVQLVWQIGKIYYDDYEQKMKSYDVSRLRMYDFLKEIDLAYAIADVIVSRAGALSISELSIVGKPVVLIPSPNVAEDHQTKNADALASNDAAILITDQDAPEKLIDTVLEILKDKDKMQRLGNNIKKLALTGATEKIADEIQKLLH
jgi:UDP-N-acetylglucosamine--N-acetylmuramyl-(pentapeptide) pyrophosphoryl-undecaprenol N-acetylglucosamine transferase